MSNGILGVKSHSDYLICKRYLQQSSADINEFILISQEDPHLIFPLLELINTTSRLPGLRKKTYSFDDFYEIYNNIISLKRFKKNIPLEKAPVHRQISTLITANRLTLNQLEVGYLQLQGSLFLSKIETYYDYNKSMPFSPILLQNIFSCSMFSKPFFHRIFSFLKLSFPIGHLYDILKRQRFSEDQLFSDELSKYRPRVYEDQILVGKEYEKIQNFLNTFYLHCLSKLNSLRKKYKNQDSIYTTSLIDQSAYKSSLNKSIPVLCDHVLMTQHFKERYSQEHELYRKQPPLVSPPPASKPCVSPTDIATSKESVPLDIPSAPYEKADPETLPQDVESKDSVGSSEDEINSLEGEWEHIPILKVERFKKRCSLNYHLRVNRWFSYPLKASLPENIFPEYKNVPHNDLEEIILFHSLPQEIDDYLRMGKEITDVESLHPLSSGKEHPHHCYQFIALPAKITHNTKAYHGLILYKINVERQLCIHRYFHKSSNAGELFQTFMFPQKIVEIINKLPEESSLEVAAAKELSTSSTLGSNSSITHENQSVIIHDPRGFDIELYSTKI